jgi:hypothetical protein
MNAQLASLTNIGITTDRFRNGSLIVRSRVNPVLLDIPTTPYITLPNPSIPLNSSVQFFAYDADLQLPQSGLKARINATLESGQSYTLVYMDQSEFHYAAMAQFSSPKLLLFKERSARSGSFVKFVNIAVFTYPQSSLSIYFAGAKYNLTFGSQSEEIEVTPGLNYELTAKFYSANKTAQFTSAPNSTTVVYLRGDYNYPMAFGYNVVTINSEGFVAEPQLPAYTPAAPNSSAKIRLVNGLALNNNYTMTIYDNGVPLFSVASVFGPYQELESGSGSYLMIIGDMLGNELFSTYVTITAGKSYSYVLGSSVDGTLLEDFPARNNGTAYLRVITGVQTYNLTTIVFQLPDPSNYHNWQLYTGETTGFVSSTANTNVRVSVDSLGWSCKFGLL